MQSDRGAAIAGARVCASSAGSFSAGSVLCTVADGDGRFQFDLGALDEGLLFASAPGFEPLVRRESAGESRAPLIFTLAPGGARISGVVLDASNGVIAGANVAALDASGSPLALGTSDTTGRFELQVAAGLSRVSARADGYAQIQRDIRAPLAGLELVLAPAAAISGRVVAETGLAPLSDVEVTAWSVGALGTAPRVERTRPDGTFTFAALLPGRYSLTAAAKSWRSDRRLIALGAAEAVDGVELSVRSATWLQGLVQVDGERCREGSVQLEGPTMALSQIAATGSVDFDGVLPGRYQVEIQCDGALTQTEQLELELGGVRRVWALKRGLQVRGVALAPDGTPVAGAQVEALPVGEPLERVNVHCTSDEQGEFTCAGLAAGEYDCSLGPGVPERSEHVRVAAGDAASPRIVLRRHPEGTLRVRIGNPEHFELPALVLLAQGKAQPVVGEQVGDEFVFPPLALGRYVVSTDPPLPGWQREIELTREGEVVSVVLQLPPPDTLSGRVVDEAGGPVPDAWITAVGESFYALLHPGRPVLADADGAFAITGLLPGRYRLRVSGSTSGAEIDDVASNRSDLVVHSSRYAAVSGSVLGSGQLAPAAD